MWEGSRKIGENKNIDEFSDMSSLSGSSVDLVSESSVAVAASDSSCTPRVSHKLASSSRDVSTLPFGSVEPTQV